MFGSLAYKITQKTDGNSPQGSPGKIQDRKAYRAGTTRSDNKWRHGSDTVNKAKAHDQNRLMFMKKVENTVCFAFPAGLGVDKTSPFPATEKKIELISC